MLIKAWKHVKKKGYLIVTLRLTNTSNFKKSYQYINFSKKRGGEKAAYHVLSINDLFEKLFKLNISKMKYYGYWGKPNRSVVTDHKKIFFVALALEKNNLNENLINFKKLEKIIK